MLGGGVIPRPGEVSLAHRGVLFMDEFAEFQSSIIEMLRQPMESGFITISRSMGSFDFPCRFILLAASNPCPCGFFGSSQKECTCSPGQIRKYRKKFSGPILDRIDLFTVLSSMEEKDFSVEFGQKLNDIAATKEGLKPETSQDVRRRVSSARKIQFERFKKDNIFCNADMQNAHVFKYCSLEKEEEQFLNKAISCYSLSARAYFKTIKISRTIADLEDEPKILIRHLAEALQHRIREF
jgi:magnesium chelatase family protein